MLVLDGNLSDASRCLFGCRPHNGGTCRAEGDFISQREGVAAMTPATVDPALASALLGWLLIPEQQAVEVWPATSLDAGALFPGLMPCHLGGGAYAIRWPFPAACSGKALSTRSPPICSCR